MAVVHVSGRGSRSDQSPLDVARTAFDLLVEGPHPLSMDGAAFEGFPDEDVPLDRVRTLLLAEECPAGTRDAVWAYLVTRSRAEGGAWTVACVGVALPALTAIAADLTEYFADDFHDIDAEVLAGFLAELATVDLSTPWIMRRLRWTAYRSGMAALRQALDRDIPLEEGFESQPPQAPSAHPDFVLVRAVADDVITEAEADLIGVTRLEEVSLRDYATSHDLDYEACKKTRLRAEYRLADYLLAGQADDATATGAGDEGVVDYLLNALALARAARRSRTRPRTVTGRQRARSQKVRKSRSPKRQKSGFRGCGRKPATPTTQAAVIPPSTPHPEERRCA